MNCLYKLILKSKQKKISKNDKKTSSSKYKKKQIKTQKLPKNILRI